MATASLSRPARTLLSSSRTISAYARPSDQTLQFLRCLNAPGQGTFSITSVRYASHQAQGRANGPKNGAGRRLGAKKTGEQLVVPGNIIYRQRGTLWFPGENCAMGRDHTIFAMQKGYVKYYKDPFKHPKRKYIGVALERDWTLPTPRDQPRRRRLGMLAVPMNEDSSHLTDNYVARPISIGGASDGGSLPKGMTLMPGEDGKIRPAFTLKDGSVIKMRDDYSFRQDNRDLGQAAERAGKVVRPFRKGNRWLAWRKRTVRKVKAAEMRSMSRKNKGKKKKAMPRV